MDVGGSVGLGAGVQIKRLAIFLGPYRNLTTLSAATLSLHPDCQVLNHASERLLSNSDLNFFDHPNRETFDRFVAAAVDASAGGRRGQFGGSIVHSHAYDEDNFKSLYKRRFGDALLKENAQCLVWKDSMRVQRRLMKEEDLFDRICSVFSEVSFILPIRNPADCALSSLRTGHVRFLYDSEDPKLEHAIIGVLNALAWVLDRRERHPDRIFVYTQWSDPTEIFEALANYLHLDAAKHWGGDAVEAFRPRGGYPHEESIRHFLRGTARDILRRWPDISQAIVDNC